MSFMRYWQGVFGVTGSYIRRFWRDKTALFFTFLFPLIFLFVFGSIFNKTDVTFTVSVFNRSDTSFASEFIKNMKADKTFKVEDSESIDVAKQKMSRGELDSIIELPSNFGAPDSSGRPAGNVTVYSQKGAEQAGQTVGAVIGQILGSINKKMGQPDAPLAVNQVVAGDHKLTNFDYTFSGLVGFTLMSMAIFGLANSMPQEKKSGAFRRLRAAPFKASQLLLANGIYYLLITLLSIVLMFAVGIGVFHFTMRGSWAALTFFAIVSGIMLTGIGLAIGGWAKNENQSAPVSNMVSFPMMFLSGSFFPRFLFPDWMQQVTAFLPLTPVIDGMRQIMTENASIVSLMPNLGLIAVWAVIIYFLAVRLFRWE